jgi:hypothetical protein
MEELEITKQKFVTLRTLHWVLEVSGDFNMVFLTFIWWMGYHTAFFILLAIWIVPAFMPGSRYGTVAKLEKELLALK